MHCTVEPHRASLNSRLPCMPQLHELCMISANQYHSIQPLTFTILPNTHAVLGTYGWQDNMFNLFGSATGMSPPQFLAIAAALMIPTVWLPNLSALSFLGVFGVAATTTVVASVSGQTHAFAIQHCSSVLPVSGLA
eukprot:1145413-Pelagomonas_calceolata.AAC.7